MSAQTTFLIWQSMAVVLLLLPCLITAIFALRWRKVLARPWPFVLIGTCCLFVVYVLIGELIFTPAFDVFIFVRDDAGQDLNRQTLMWGMFRELAPTPITLMIAAYPILRWIRNLLPSRKGAAIK